MLGGWRRPRCFLICSGGMKMSKKEKIEHLRKLLSHFSEEEKDRILEILQLVLEMHHSPLSA